MGQGIIVPNAGFGKGMSQSMATLPSVTPAKSARPLTAVKTKAVILRLTTPSQKST